MKGRIKVFIADDHAIVRKGLHQLISETADMELVGEAKNAQEAMEGVRREKPDVLVLDISMPGSSGLDLLHGVRRHHKDLKVLILTMHPESHYAVRVLQAGASGFLTKEAIPEELTDAIRKVFTGRKHVSSAVGEILASKLDVSALGPPHEMLSDREFDVLRLIGSGLTVSAIAEELSLSVKTISTYRSRILEKMNMKTNAELTRYVIENRLLD